MANTYTQIYIQIVFSTHLRGKLIKPSFKEELYKYITGIIRNKDQKLLAIGGVSDHIHIFLGMKPNIALSDLVRDVKHFSTEFIKEKGFVRGKFNWQSGFGAFSYSHSQIDNVVKYIQRQEEHHKVMTFQEEYVEFLEKFKIDYDEKYVFD